VTDHDQRKASRDSGWASGDDYARPELEHEGPSVFPLAYRSDRVWRRTLGCLWVPAIAAVLTIELWLNVSQEAVWLSLAGLLPAFFLAGRWIDRNMS
jgi:hypothetical protein